MMKILTIIQSTKLRDAYQRAGEHLQLQDEKRREHHSEMEYTPIQTGQLVYLRNHIHGCNKIQDAWDSTPYKVVAVPMDGQRRTSVYPRKDQEGTPYQPEDKYSQSKQREKEPGPKPVIEPKPLAHSSATDDELVIILPKECRQPTPLLSVEPEPIVRTSAEPVCPGERTYRPK